MIVCVSPSSAHFDETQNTLRYANRAKNIQTKVTRNVFNVNRHVKDFLVKIDEQMALINELKAQQKDAEKIFFAKFRKQMDKQNSAVREGVLRLRTAYDNSAAERQEKVANMKKLKGFERRIGLLSAWIASFDAICHAREDDGTMPPSLTAMRKTAQGILMELEHSRQHIHQKLERSNWERAIDSALQHSISQLPAADSADCGERDTLAREAEMLKSNFTRDAYREVLDMDRAGDAAIVQILLTAHFDILSSLSETLNMNEEEAVSQAKSIINRLLETGYSAASNVIKPDGSLVTEGSLISSPKGTPKRKKSLNVNSKPIPAADVLSSVPQSTQEQVSASPVKSSPRRRKAGTARKGVSFTPVKKRSPAARRVVRWRDDETEEGTIADFEKTPLKTDSTPEISLLDSRMAPTAVAPAAPPIPSYLGAVDSDNASDSSPSLPLPDITTVPMAKSNRFQAGFLSRSRQSYGPGNGSPVPPTLSLNLSASSDSEERVSSSFHLP